MTRLRLARHALPLLLLLLSVAAAPAARAEDAPPPATATALPVEVALGFYVFEIRDVNWKAQTFVADLYLWLRYATGDDERAKTIEAFDLMNGMETTKEEVDRYRDGDERYVCWRVISTFFMKPDLRRYPFDRQRLSIIVEPHWYDVREQVFVDDARSYAASRAPPDLSGVRPDVAITEFDLVSTERVRSRTIYDTDFGNFKVGNEHLPYSRFTFSIVFARRFEPYLFKILTPLLIIIAMAYLVFLLPPSEVQTASGLGITAVLTCIAFNVSVGQNLPDIGYLVTSDKFFLATYFLLFLTLLQSVLVFRWERQGHGDFAERWYARCRRVFPLLYGGAFLILLADALTGGRSPL